MAPFVIQLQTEIKKQFRRRLIEDWYLVFIHGSHWYVAEDAVGVVITHGRSVPRVWTPAATKSP